jgi:hypothetical protein
MSDSPRGPAPPDDDLRFRVNEWQRLWRTEVPEEAVIQLQEILGPWRGGGPAGPPIRKRIVGIISDYLHELIDLTHEECNVEAERIVSEYDASGGSAGAATEAALRRVLVHLVSACDYVMPYVRGEPTPHRSQPQGSAAKQFARKVESLRAGLGLSEADTWKEAMDGRFTSPQEAAEFTESTVRAALSEPRNVSPTEGQ